MGIKISELVKHLRHYPWARGKVSLSLALRELLASELGYPLLAISGVFLVLFATLVILWP